MILLLVILISLVLHLFLGWQWTILAGVVGGLLAKRFGWVDGMLGVALAWLLLLFRSYVVAATETARLTDLVGGMIGNQSAVVVVGATLCIAGVLGLLGGLLGGMIRQLFIKRKKPEEPAHDPVPAGEANETA